MTKICYLLIIYHKNQICWISGCNFKSWFIKTCICSKGGVGRHCNLSYKVSCKFFVSRSQDENWNIVQLLHVNLILSNYIAYRKKHKSQDPQIQFLMSMNSVKISKFMIFINLSIIATFPCQFKSCTCFTIISIYVLGELYIINILK